MIAICLGISVECSSAVITKKWSLYIMLYTLVKGIKSLVLDSKCLPFSFVNLHCLRPPHSCKPSKCLRRKFFSPLAPSIKPWFHVKDIFICTWHINMKIVVLQVVGMSRSRLDPCEVSLRQQPHEKCLGLTYCLRPRAMCHRSLRQMVVWVSYRSLSRASGFRLDSLGNWCELPTEVNEK